MEKAIRPFVEAASFCSLASLGPIPVNTVRVLGKELFNLSKTCSLSW